MKIPFLLTITNLETCSFQTFQRFTSSNAIKMDTPKLLYFFFLVFASIQLSQSDYNPNGGSFGNVEFNSVYSIGNYIK